MKVLCLDQSGQLGGGEIALLPWLCLQRDQCHVVLFEDGPFRVCLKEGGVPVEVVALTGVQHIRRESGLRSILQGVPALFRACVELRELARSYDVLYANSMKAIVVAALIRRWRQPVVWHLRDILSREHFSTLLRLIVVTIGNCCASAIIVNSHATANAFVKAGGRRSKVEVVYDGVSGTKFESLAAPAILQLRTEYSAPGRLLLGVFSRLSQWKGQHVVLEAVSSLPEIDLLIVGDALFGEAEYAGSLRQRAAQPDLSGRVHFAGFRQDVAALMQCVDIVVHSSTSAEPFGLVIVEGMLAGKPVVATRAGGAVEIIETGVSGLLVEPGSASALRDAIVLLRDRRDEAAGIAQAGRLRARQTFPLSAMFSGINDVLCRLNSRGDASTRDHEMQM